MCSGYRQELCVPETSDRTHCDCQISWTASHGCGDYNCHDYRFPHIDKHKKNYAETDDGTSIMEDLELRGPEWSKPLLYAEDKDSTWLLLHRQRAIRQLWVFEFRFSKNYWSRSRVWSHVDLNVGTENWGDAELEIRFIEVEIDK